MGDVHPLEQRPEYEMAVWEPNDDDLPRPDPAPILDATRRTAGAVLLSVLVDSLAIVAAGLMTAGAAVLGGLGPALITAGVACAVLAVVWARAGL
jgi:hypothetical protein